MPRRAWSLTAVERRASVREAARAAVPLAPTSLTSIVMLRAPAARVLVWRTAYLWRRCQRVFLSILRCLCLLIFFRRFLTTEPMKPPDRTRNREQGLSFEPLVPRSLFLAARFLLWLELQKCYFGRNAIVSGLHRHVYPGAFRRAVDEVRCDARAFFQLDDRKDVWHLLCECGVHSPANDGVRVDAPASAHSLPFQPVREAVRADATRVEDISGAVGAALEAQFAGLQPFPEGRRDGRRLRKGFCVLRRSVAHSTASSSETCSLMMPPLPLTKATWQSATWRSPA